MGICGKIFIINLHNRKMLFMLRIKNVFSECLAPCTNMNAPNGRLSGNGSALARRHGGYSGEVIFFVPHILLCSEKFVFEHMLKIKISPP